jgi:hypothetical protein
VEQAAVVAFIAARNLRTSLRAIAAEIGISKSSVDALVTSFHERREMPGPRKKTWAKLRQWYLREKYAEEGTLQDPVDMSILLHELLATIPEGRRHEALTRTVAHFRDLYDAAKTPRPAWLQTLIEGDEQWRRDHGRKAPAR